MNVGMNIRTISLLSLVLFVHASALADEVDKYIRGQMEDQRIPGLSMAVLRQGKAIKSQGYGHADLERKIRVTADTVFQLQSITKSFTATAVLMLVEDNKISVEDPISKYLEALPASWKGITITHLLTHTSGIKDFINEPTVDLAKDLEPQDVIRSLEKLPLNFEPGARYAYSNTGYHLLGMIIEKITGDTWQNFLRQKIFKPLKMKSTDVNSAKCDLRNQALGYTWRSNRFERGAYIAPTILGYAGGGILSTVIDLARWDRALFTDQLISRSTLEQMWTPAKLCAGGKTQYGLGWAVDDYLGLPTVGHGGAHMTGFKSYFARFLKQELTVIVLCNSRQANPANIALGIAGFYIPEVQISRLKEREDPSPGRSDTLKKALTDLAARKESTLVTSEFLRDYTRSSERATTLAGRLKAIKSFAFLGARDISENKIERYSVPVKDICFYRLTTPSESRYYTFYLTSDGRVASYQSSAP
jgi:CubicO group peptidase (beta-lactamase class C family)